MWLKLHNSAGVMPVQKLKGKPVIKWNKEHSYYGSNVPSLTDKLLHTQWNQ